MKPLLFSLLSLCLLAGCKKDGPQQPVTQMCPTQCTALPFNIAFTSDYTAEDLGTAIMRRYEPDGTFTTLAGEQGYTLADTVHYADIGVGFRGLSLHVGYDYEITIPATQQVFRISGMTETTEVQDINCATKNRVCVVPPTPGYTIAGGDSAVVQVGHYVYLRVEK